jgi:hypothetical protein
MYSLDHRASRRAVKKDFVTFLATGVSGDYSLECKPWVLVDNECLHAKQFRYKIIQAGPDLVRSYKLSVLVLCSLLDDHCPSGACLKLQIVEGLERSTGSTGNLSIMG